MNEAKKRVKKSGEVECLKKSMQEVLKEEGLYKKSMRYQVEMAATNMLLYRKAAVIVLEKIKDGKLVVVEMSREGNVRARIMKELLVLEKLSNLARKDLTALGMNMERQVKVDDGHGADDDPLVEMIRRMDEIEE